MTLLDEVLQANQAYLEHTQEVNTWSKYPQKHLAIVSCMDTRLVELLEPALGIRRGEVKMIKTAGNTITSKFDDVIRSLLVCIYQFDIKEIMVIGHYGCGMATATSKELIDTFHNPKDNVEKSVASIHENPLIPNEIPVHGLIINPDTGKVDVVVNGY